MKHQNWKNSGYDQSETIEIFTQNVETKAPAFRNQLNGRTRMFTYKKKQQQKDKPTAKILNHISRGNKSYGDQLAKLSSPLHLL